MTLDSCSDQSVPLCSFSRGPASSDRPEPSDNRLAKRQRTSNLGNSTDAGDPLPGPDEVDTRTDETPREHHWLDGGLTSSLPLVVDLEVSNVSANSADDGAPGRGLYTSSLYTDAFNLALDTVLAEESHLFSEQETEVFQKYRSLPYEAQYLYHILSLSRYPPAFVKNIPLIPIF